MRDNQKVVRNGLFGEAVVFKNCFAEDELFCVVLEVSETPSCYCIFCYVAFSISTYQLMAVCLNLFLAFVS